ncbi:N-acetylglucosamine kinase [Rhizobium sp. CFBP 8762]|uniref:N-acetylglucosamine kinase n=1 Tax=Rhizobium sp. CFBP 8762 TaxID=2775279 RepID=UPI0017857788|nr:BadF/BadG/BcrA/BcrD ATPase family protein [Rhizobium sp. CFBP 8762]MBD8555003.1 N-acetylglucosamine kinase [Rhizobium sp. CFBP 8762]
MGNDLILGIDGGGSKVLVALADRSGRILRTSRGGGVNPMDNPNWRQELERHILPFQQLGGLVAVGAALPAFGEVTHLSALQTEAIESAFPSVPQRVLNDVEGAHIGAFGGKPGILILSGTGSMAWATGSDGRTARSGGWGERIGDEGSSHWLGQKALNLISQSLDGRAPATALADAVFDHLGIERANPMDGLGNWASTLKNPRAQIAALSILVDRVAAQGDAGAIELIEQAANELAKHYQAVKGALGQTVDWTYAGGTFTSQILLKTLEHKIGAAAVAPKLPPIGGALMAAAQRLGWLLDESWFEQIASTAEGVGVTE